jgi:hypothetical protein
MKLIFELARFCLVILAVGGMFYAARYSMSQGIQTVIASQPPAPKLMEPPRFDTFRDCELIPLYGTKSSKPPCKFELSPPPKPAPIPVQTMSKADAEKAGLWFLLSTLALPLALGGAVAVAYLIKE